MGGAAACVYTVTRFYIQEHSVVHKAQSFQAMVEIKDQVKGSTIHHSWSEVGAEGRIWKMK